MKILLAAVNAKYIHSNPAVYLLRAAAGPFKERVEVAEYTINEQSETILADLYRRRPDVLAFSCYIWNRREIAALLRDLPKVLPDTIVLLGGPEVSFDAPAVLKEFPGVCGIMAGEGEITFREVTGALEKLCGSSEADPISVNERAVVRALMPVRGLWLRGEDETAVFTGERELISMDEIPFFYEEWAEDPDLGPFKKRILYYESARGCPFRCSYCLSSLDKTLRLRSLRRVLPELQFFLDRRVPQVKFIDRTFNADKTHAMAIWRYLAEHDNGVTNFHFEIAADLLTEEETELLSGMRPGLIQLEIGVQTINPVTVREIRRTMDLDRLSRAVNAVRAGRNIHQHLDLIAGLPEEDYPSFIKSFNAVFALQPDELQLGFLKVLKGSYMAEMAEEYGLRFQADPPYEVLSTKWISYGELRQLKKVEAMVELYYNSGQFTRTLASVMPHFESPFAFFAALAKYYEEKGFFTNQPARIYRYEVLRAFLAEHFRGEAAAEEYIAELMTFDLYLRENMKSRPVFARDLTPFRDELHALEKTKKDRIEVFFYPVWEDAAKRADEADAGKALPQRRNRPCFIRFDYEKRDPLTGNAEAEFAELP